MYLATLRCTYIYVIRANEFKTSTSLLSHVALHDTPATMGWSIIGTVRLKHMGTTLEHGVGSSSLLWNMQYEVPIHTVSALSSPSRSTEWLRDWRKVRHQIFAKLFRQWRWKHLMKVVVKRKREMTAAVVVAAESRETSTLFLVSWKPKYCKRVLAALHGTFTRADHNSAKKNDTCPLPFTLRFLTFS